MIGRVRGVIVTLGEAPEWERRGPGLYHLRVPAAAVSHLAWILQAVLSLVQGEADEQDGRRVCELDLQRMRDDIRRLAEQSSDTSRLLSSELSERRNAQKSLEESRRSLRTIFDSVNDAVFVHDAATCEILDVNRRMCELYGLTREEALRAKPADLSSNVAPFDTEHVKLCMLKAAGGSPLTFEWQARHHSGRIMWVEVSLRAAEIGGRACVLATVRDIGERKEADERRSRFELKMQQAQKLESLGVLAGGIAHDFNNLLMAILGNADLALMEMAPLAPLRHNISEIVKASRRAADLCSQMLAYAGKGKFVIRSVNINDLVADMSHMLAISVSKKVTLRFELANHMPAVEADSTQIQQIIMNLVINASEAIGDNDGVVSLTTGVQQCAESFFRDSLWGTIRPEGEYAFVEVADTGVGIAPDDLFRIFEPFYSTKFTGRGLGLAAVQGIVNSHRGAIKLTSELGKGSRFRILLPASAKPMASVAAKEQPLVKGVGTILLVDDEEAIRTITGKMLEAIGYTVIMATDGYEAVQLVTAQRTSITCVLLDLNMPRMNGEETYSEIRKLAPALPILISSGYGEQDILARFSDKRDVGVIQKPYQMASLREKLHEILMANRSR